MTDHEDLLRSLLVERYRPWRPNSEPDMTPTRPAREMGQERRRRQRPGYRSQRSQTETNTGRRTT